MGSVNDHLVALDGPGSVNDRLAAFAASMGAGAIGPFVTEATVQTKRQSTGSVAGGATATIAVSWPIAFADALYTVSAVVFEGTGSTSTLRVHHCGSPSTTGFNCVVVNDDAITAKTGTIHAIAYHD